MPRTPAVVLAVFVLAGSAAPAAPSDAELKFFETKVRPVLAEHCYSCHGPQKQKAGLRLDTTDGVKNGGSSGDPLVTPGDPKNSLLVRAVSHADGVAAMPPKGKLTAAQVADLTRWAAMGAPFPAPAVKPPDPGESHWAFQPVKRPDVPKLSAQHSALSTHPIDAFVRTKLEAAGLKPAPPADKRTLIRRATFDLTGLPPTPAEIDAFLADPSPGAFAKVVDRLLASPAYGERWGRHWLDVARYADSNGLDENTAFGNAWRYRDYVIRSFNADKPFDRFVREQVAGDLLPSHSDAERADNLTATGYLVLGPKLLAEPDKQKMLLDVADEQLDTLGKGLMGLTLGCARCHDHKFDPIPTRDYYSLLAVFTSTRTMQNLNTVAKAFEAPLPTTSPQQAARAKEIEKKLFAKTREVRLAQDKVRKEPDAEKKKPLQEAVKKLQAEVEAIRKETPPGDFVLCVEEGTAAAYGTQPRNLYVQVRGNYVTPGEEAPAVFPRVIAGEQQAPFVPAKPNPADKPEPAKTRFGQVRERSGRLELANWLTDPRHPLTARVFVNRLWQHHFGEGLVRSPDNFGQLGERPTHPELLDWLARRFVESGWSVKHLHRTMLLTSAYQMSSAHNPSAAATDPDNRLLWRYPRRRLEAEAIRDAMLAVAGNLDRTVGGSLLANGNFEYINNEHSKGEVRYGSARRSVYLPVIRNNVFPFFQTFDFPEPSVMTGKRASTVVAPQALYLMNSPFAAKQAEAFADRVLKAEPSDDARRVALAYRLAYGREPAAAEVSRALGFAASYQAALDEKDAAKRRAAAWAALCQSVFAGSEFVYVN